MIPDGLRGLCEHYFTALKMRKDKEFLNPSREKCLSDCNGRYDPHINNCIPKIISLQDFRKLQREFPGSYLV